MTKQEAIDFGQELKDELQAKETTNLAASLAFYSIFSLGPLVVLAVVMLGWIFGEAAAEGQIVGTASQVLGAQGAEAVQSMLAQAHVAGGGWLATIGSLAMLLFGASAIFTHLKRALNRIWDVHPRDESLKRTAMNRVFGAGAVLVGVLLLVGLIAFNAVIGALAGRLDLGGQAWVYQGISYAGIALVAFIGVTSIFKFLPDVKIGWKSVLPGAALTTVLLAALSYGFGLYLQYTSTTSMYGAAGSIIAVLLWIYFSALVLFVGAEFTQVWARRRGDGMEPEDDAEWDDDHVASGRRPRVTPHPEVPESWPKGGYSGPYTGRRPDQPPPKQR